MFQPSSPQPAPPPLPDPATPEAEVAGHRGLRLLEQVRHAQRRALWAQGLLLAVPLFVVTLIIAGLVAIERPRLGQAVVALAPLLSGLVLAFFAWLARRKVGDAERTARLLAASLPGLNLDLLAAVELSSALGKADDFSPDLARAFLRTVDARAARHPPHTLVDRRPTRRAAAAFGLALLACASVLAFKGAQVRGGLLLAFTSKVEAGPTRREPITGDFELSYRYPAHTGLDARTVASSNGEVSAPAGTEVRVTTRADRDVDDAALIINGVRTPMVVKGRELSAQFMLEASGQYHVAFLDGARVVAEGPDLALTAVVDQSPQVRVLSPLDGLELDPATQTVQLKFEASDDYGLAALELVSRAAGGEEKRTSLKPDDGRTTRGQYAWDVGALKLKPGQTVAYFVQATDNDAVKGPKTGVSSTLHLKLYSAAEHRREALKKAEALWERLIAHLADRMEASDRVSPSTPDSAVAGKPIDTRATLLVEDLNLLVGELDRARDPVDDVRGALRNVSDELQRDTAAVTMPRRVLLRLSGRDGVPAFDGPGLKVVDLGRRLAASLAVDLQHSEKNVLYLEALLDRQKLAALKELARELKEDRSELARLLEDFAKTKDPQTQAALLEQMSELKERMLELRERMSELARGIRDDFMNADALQQMMEDENLPGSLEEIEKLIQEGNAEEALKKMQELSMQMDQFLDSLDEAADQADERADPELARDFTAFQDDLEQTVAQQDALAERTRQLRDKHRGQQKERIARQGEALKKELSQRLDELQKSYRQLDADRYGPRFQELKTQAERAVENVQQSLKANDFDLASDSADRLEEHAGQLAESAEDQRRNDELFKNPPEVRRESKQLHDQLQRDGKKAEEVARKLRDLFPQPGQQLSDADRASLQEQARQQKQLEQRAQRLQQQMQDINERAPVFDRDAQQQMQQAGERMGEAGERLQGRDASRGFGEQQGALQSLKSIQQSLQQGGQGGKGGLPLPVKGSRGGGRGTQSEKVELPDDDPNQAPREFRKNVMDAMKQGAPDRYREQNKKYYEELVK